MDPNQYPPEYLAEDRSRELLRVIVPLAVFETLFFVLFIWARILKKTTNGVDFWLMPAAYVACFSHVISISLGIKYGGLGRHIVAVTPGELVIFFKTIYSEDYLYLFSVMLPKLALLCLYLRIFIDMVYRYIAYGVAIVMFLNWLTGCLMALLICKPIAFNWDKTIPGGHCGNIMGAYIWASFPNILTDVVMLLLPLPVIWNLHTSRSQKLGLTLTFLVGGGGIVTSVIRFTTFFTIDIFSDPTWYGVTSQTWTCVEPGVYFIAATLPSLRSLAVAAFRTARDSNSSTILRKTLRLPLSSLSNKQTPPATGEKKPSPRSGPFPSSGDSAHHLDEDEGEEGRGSDSPRQWWDHTTGRKSDVDVRISEHEYSHSHSHSFEMA